MSTTMAILGDTGNFNPEVMEVLLQKDLRLLFVSEDEEQLSFLKTRMNIMEAVAEVDYISCEREGCWEADMILLVNPHRSSEALVEKIREVATQKIVLVTSETHAQQEQPNLKKLLPWSRVVEVYLDPVHRKISFCSNDAEATHTVEQFFEPTGYQLN